MQYIHLVAQHAIGIKSQLKFLQLALAPYVHDQLINFLHGMQNLSSCHGVGKRAQNKNNRKQCTILFLK